jgi:hypothetical protein
MTSPMTVLCVCGHPRSDHNEDDPIESDGCLNGWGKPPAVGCMCRGFRFRGEAGA